jgi:hypothetical protein
MSTNRWIDKENVLHIYNEILYSLLKEGNSTFCDDMNKLWGHYAKWNNPVTERQILRDSLYIKYLKY